MDLLRLRLREAVSTGIDPAACYECLLQTYLFAGFPPALEGLRLLQSTLCDMSVSWTPPDREPFDVKAFRLRGEELYRKIYSSNHGALQKVVESFSPDMFEYMILEGYGKILSRPGMTGQQRELSTVTALTALGWERQVISHARGAVNLGAELPDVFEAIALAEECSSRERVDQIVEAVAPHLKK